MSDFPRQFDVIENEPEYEEPAGDPAANPSPLAEGLGTLLILLGVAVVLAVCCGGAYKILELVIPHA